ncbi:MAG TPA: radical SAM family heme chaperone HemW [Puia sp.]|nr:radical SAM family heme chaperone HemW [Puia sp.]
MAGIYLHIPFCKQACNYCNFHFSTSLRNKNDFVAALLKEIVFQKEYLADEEIETVYFGGGTPSLLTIEDLNLILQQLHSVFKIHDKAELTFEANPDDISDEKLKQWKSAGINRLSIGIQSFFEEDLKWMNRAHNVEQAINSIKSAQKNGFDNITIDLIYGTPTLSNERWEMNIETAINFNIPHLSCYALTVEPKTMLHKMIEQKKTLDINPDTQAEQFVTLMDLAGKAGYEHYEISNFAQPGKRSRHNSSYWEGKKYLGLGPSAHSYNGKERRWNVANNNLYIQSLEENKILFEKEKLNDTQRLNEYIMISLRTIEGLDLNIVEKNFSKKTKEEIFKTAHKHIQNRNIIFENSKLILTREGKLLADGIAADLFFEEEN